MVMRDVVVVIVVVVVSSSLVSEYCQDELAADAVAVVGVVDFEMDILLLLLLLLHLPVASLTAHWSHVLLALHQRLSLP